MPSLSPLSTLSTRRTRVGSRSSAITGALNAASVGARLAAIRPAKAIGRLGKNRIASAVPATMDSGSPIPSKRAVSGRSRRAAVTGTAEASANNNNARVSSARWCSVELSRSTLTSPQRGFPRSRPPTARTNGPLRLSAVKRSASTAHPKITNPRATAVASFMIELSERRRRHRALCRGTVCPSSPHHG